MVPLDRALVSSYRLSIVTMSLSAAVWPQFATQSFRQHHVHRNSLFNFVAYFLLIPEVVRSRLILTAKIGN